MNKLIVTLIAFVSIPLVCLAQPKFVIVGGDGYDWGKVSPADSPLKATVTFKNEGNEKLVISKVKPGCGCTAAKPEKDTLEPGDTTTMSIELRISGSGLQHKTIDIETNDPDKKITKYKLTCDLVRDIIIKPGEHISFRGEHVIVGKEILETFFIKNNSDKPIKFYDLQVAPDMIKLSLPTDFILKPGEEKEATAKWTPTESNQQFNGQIIIKTDSNNSPTITIGMHGHAMINPMSNEPADGTKQPNR
ncbi:MAG: DUF1573 domain-containing protein [Bacteroidetes bacterium]|nr:DUF1573 domain-containing protein [Bacteroidota bacterium]